MSAPYSHAAVKRKRLENERQEEAKLPFGRRRREMDDEIACVFAAPITRVMYPKGQALDWGSVEQTTYCVVVVQDKTWAGKGFLSLDSQLYEHDIEGRIDEQGSRRYGRQQYRIENIRSVSVPITTENCAKIFTALLDYTFNGNEIGWTDADRKNAEDALSRITIDPAFRFDAWFHEKSSAFNPPHWVTVMADNAAVQTYCVCLSTAELLQHYPLAPITRLTLTERLKLVKQLNSDPYPLFFDHMYEGKFPGLPELQVKTVHADVLCEIGLEKLLNVWLYQRLYLDLQLSRSTFTQLELRGRRWVILLQSSHKHEQKSRQAATKKAICAALGVSEHGAFPDSGHGTFEPILRNLQKQGTVIVDKTAVHLRHVLWRTMFIVAFFKRLANSGCEDYGDDWKDPDPTVAMDNEAWQTVSDSRSTIQLLEAPKQTLATMVAALERGDKKIGNFRPYDQQRAAMLGIAKNNVHMLGGLGGCGKSAVTVELPGRGIQPWRGHLSVVATYPQQFFIKGMAMSLFCSLYAKLKDKMLDPPKVIRKPHKLYLTPTGIASENINDSGSARERGESLSMTASMFLVLWNRAGQMELFSELRIVVMDEFSMWSELLLHDVCRCLAQLKHLRRVVPVGDPNQLPSIDYGQVLKDMFACSHIPRVELTQNMRAAAASTATRQEKLAAECLTNNLISMTRGSELQPMDGVFEFTCADHMPLSALFDRYSSPEGLINSQIMTVTNAMRRFVNDYWMQRMGLLSDADRDNPRRPHILYKGQKIRFTKNANEKDFSVRNGTREVIKDIFDTEHAEWFVGPDAGLMTMAERKHGRHSIDNTATEPSASLDKKRTRRIIECYSGRFYQITAKVLAQIEPGYCSTVHSMQSLGVDHAIFWDDKQNLYYELLFTAASRARRSFTFICHGSQSLPRFMEGLKRRDTPRNTMLSKLFVAQGQQPYAFSTPCVDCGKKGIKWAPDLGASLTIEPPLCPLCIEKRFAAEALANDDDDDDALFTDKLLLEKPTSSSSSSSSPTTRLLLPPRE